jgi:hypothetical protein
MMTVPGVGYVCTIQMFACYIEELCVGYNLACNRNARLCGDYMNICLMSNKNILSARVRIGGTGVLGRVGRVILLQMNGVTTADVVDIGVT